MGLFAILRGKSIRKPAVKVIQAQRLKKINIVRPDNTPLYLKRGWAVKRNKYHGYYRTPYGAWRGEIFRRGDKFNVLIFKPPLDKIKKHSRWPCFHKEKMNKWRIDLAKNPRDGDISAIIFYVERLIIESFRK